MKRLMCFYLVCLSMVADAQESNTGIQWVTDLSFDQVKEKAKVENKYIFLDCFTTWCGPCKTMEKYVYTTGSVGDFFNKHFLSVKVQMDKTDNDDPAVKSWYTTAATIEKDYYVEGYPTFIFLSPQGEIVHKEMGLRDVNAFVGLAKIAIEPGKTYVDPAKEGDKWIERYKQGELNYDKMPVMVERAFKLMDTALYQKLVKKHLDYVSNLPVKKRYTRENIGFWKTLNFGTTSRIFKFFYNDGDQINRVMKSKTFSREVIDEVIMDKITRPFLIEQADGTNVAMTGAYITHISADENTANKSEADWEKLENILKEKFNDDCAKRNVLLAKVEWYERHENKAASAKYYLDFINKYPPTIIYDPQSTVASWINNRAYDAFLWLNNAKILEGYLPWMKKVVTVFAKLNNAAWIDTYACLLYKTGRKEEAIKWMAKTVASVPPHSEKNSYDVKLDEMKLGKPLSEAKVW